jgi:hypothetical protein
VILRPAGTGGRLVVMSLCDLVVLAHAGDATSR